METDQLSLTAPLTRRQLLSRGGRVAKGAGMLVAASAVGLGTWGAVGEARWIQLSEVTVFLRHLPPAFEGYRIAHLSDIHVESGDTRKRWPELCRWVTSLHPDAICLTGDYISEYAPDLSGELMAGLRELRAKDGVFGITGNHDHNGHLEASRRSLAQCDIQELVDSVAFIHKDGQQISIGGVQDVYVGGGDFRPVLEAFPAANCNILLAHEPDPADYVASTGRVDLMLSGHSHGGQICLPTGPVVLPVGGRKYPRGHYSVGDLQLYTNRGIGTIGFPVRLFSRPEIAIFTLKRPPHGSQTTGADGHFAPPAREPFVLPEKFNPLRSAQYVPAIKASPGHHSL